MTATYNYLGYGVTDNQGKAKLEYDAQGNPLTHSYTGTGAGKVDIVASLDSEIDESSLVSEPDTIIDALLFDPCTEAVTGRWYNYNTILDVSYSTDGLTVTKPSNDGTTTRYLYYNDPTISTTKVGGYNSITTPIEILFNVKAITGSIQLVIVDNNSNQRFIDITETGNYKLTFNGSTLVIKLNDTQLGNSYVVDGSNFQFRFGFNAQDESITIKDFTVYPI